MCASFSGNNVAPDVRLKLTLVPIDLVLRQPALQTDKETQEMVRRRSYSGYSWCMLWSILLRHNLFACVRDTRAGVRRSRLQRTSGSRWSAQRVHQGQDQTSKRALSPIPGSVNEDLPEDESDRDERWKSEHESEGESKLDVTGNDRKSNVPRVSEAESGEFDASNHYQWHRQSPGASNNTRLGNSSQHGIIPWRRPVAVDIPNRSFGRVPAYATDDSEEQNNDESETTAEGVETGSGGVRTRDPKPARGISIRIGGRAPTEEDVPKRLPGRFSQFEISHEETADSVVKTSGKENDKRLDPEVVDTGEFAGDGEMDRGETSSSRTLCTDSESTFRAASWKRPAAVDFPRKSSAQGSTYVTKDKTKQTDDATDANTEDIRAVQAISGEEFLRLARVSVSRLLEGPLRRRIFLGVYPTSSTNIRCHTRE